MARQFINIGTVANDGTGDTLRAAFDKVNDNFIEIYADVSDLSNTAFSGDYDDLTNKPDLDLYLLKSNANTDVSITARNISFTSTGDTQTLSGDSIRLYANTNVTIETEGTGVSKFWIFRSDGALNFPDGTTQETAFSASATNITEWNQAYSWGDHSTIGYLTSANTDADTINYQASANTDWEGNSAPTTIGEAIDRLAAAVKALNGTGA